MPIPRNIARSTRHSASSATRYDPNYRYYANQTPLNVNSNLTFSAASLDATGFLLNLPGNGYSTGTPVVYHANGGSVTGLSDGAHVLRDRSTRATPTRSAWHRATQMRSPRMPIHLSAITGTNNTLSEIFANPNVPFGAANIDITGFLIDLPGNAYTTGQAVVYHANGGSASGLTDGGTYYVIVNPSNPNQISLAATYADATAVTPVPIQALAGHRHAATLCPKSSRPSAPRTSTPRVSRSICPRTSSPPARP